MWMSPEVNQAEGRGAQFWGGGREGGRGADTKTRTSSPKPAKSKGSDPNQWGAILCVIRPIFKCF